MYSSSTPADKAVEETVWRKRRKKSSHFYFLNDGQTENPNLDAPHLCISPTDASLSLSFSVHFNFCFTVCTRTEIMYTFTALKGMQSTEMRGTKTCLSPNVACVFRVHQSRSSSDDACCIWLNVTIVAQLTVMCVNHWIFSFQNVSTRLLEIVLCNLVLVTCLISHSF